MGIPIALLIIAIITIWFVETRLITLLGIRRVILFRCLFAAAYAIGLVGFILADKSTNMLVGLMYWFGGVSWIALIYLAIAFLISGLIVSLGVASAQWAHSAALCCALGLTAWGVYGARDFTVNTTEIALAKIDEPFTIMHISDVHLGYHRGRDYLQKIVDATNRHHPDLVIINGDLLDAKVALDQRVLEPLRKLNAPVYFTGGNHEKYVDQAGSEELIAAMGGASPTQ